MAALGNKLRPLEARRPWKHTKTSGWFMGKLGHIPLYITYNPYHPCMVYLPTFTISIKQMWANYTIHGLYGYVPTIFFSDF